MIMKALATQWGVSKATAQRHVTSTASLIRKRLYNYKKHVAWPGEVEQKAVLIRHVGGHIPKVFVYST